MNTDIHALIGAYALDAVTDSERSEFEEHLHECADCRSELAGLRETAALLGTSARAMPPPSLRQSLLTQIATVRPLPPVVQSETDDDQDSADQAEAVPAVADHRARRRAVRRWLAAAVAAAAIVVGTLTWHPWTASEPIQETAVQRVLQAPDAHRYIRHVAGATVTVTYSPRLAKSVLATTNMEPAPTGHTYQIWYLTAAGKATKAGFVTPSHNGSSKVLLKGDAGGAALIGITVEPAGGSPQPTTKPIMTVKLAT